MKFIGRIVITALLLLSVNVLDAQISSTGRTFYLSFMEMEARSGGYPDSLLVYITSATNQTIQVSNPRIGGTTQNISIQSGKVNRYSADPGFYYPQGYEKAGSDIESKRSLKIEAKDPINVYCLNLEINRSDGTFVLPYESIPMAPEFYITAFTPTQYTGGKYMPSEFVVVGMDNVTIEVTPTTKLASGKVAGSSYTVNLSRGQVYQVQSDGADGATGGNSTKGDLTGTRVRVINSCGKINVFAGMRSVKIPSSACGIAVDHLYTQVFPTNILGKQHVLMPFKDQSKGYVFRVVATKPSTKIWVNGTLVATKNAGEWYQQDITTNTTTCVTVDSSAYVVQYMKNGGTCAGTTGNNGDPAILIMPDYNQKLLKSIVGTATTNNMNKHYVNILVATAAKSAVKLNGSYIAPGNFVDIPCAGHSYAQISVANPSTNTIECDSGMIVVVYGMGQYESYSYCSGALFENLEYDFKIDRKGKCPGETVKLSATSTNPKIKGYIWNFGDGSPEDTGKVVNHKFQKVGAFFVVMKVIIPGACGKNDTVSRSKIIDILQGPLFDLKDTVFQCASTLSYPITGPSKTSFFYKWHDSSTSNKYTATTAGKVWVKIHDTVTRCTVYDSTWVKHYSPLSVQVGMDTADMCRPTNFFSMSDNTGYTNDSYKSAKWKVTRWHLPVSKRDTFSTLDRFRISFDTFGLFPLKYVVTSKLGCVDSITLNLGVYHLPTAVFNTLKSEYCQKELATFVDSSTGEGGIGKSYWDFTTGAKDTGLKVFYAFNTYDTFRVKLITETIYGCRDTVDSAIVVHPLPVMAMGLTTNNVCKKANSFSFTDNSTIPYGTATNSWKYEKTTIVNQTAISNIKFSDTGTWKMRLFNTSDKGCTDSTSKSVYVAPEPKATLALLDSSKCFDTHFFNLDDVSTISKGTLSGRKWTFSDGTSATTKLVNKKKFSAFGVYNVKLVVTSTTYGCKDSVNRNLQVFAAPSALFGIDDSVQCDAGNLFNFTPNSSFFVSGVTPSFKWAFGDGSNATTESSSHSYSGTGKFTVQFIISTSQGCADTTTRTAEVVATPTASFTLSKDSTCLGTHNYDFTNTTSFGGGFTSKWNLGDGNTSTSTSIAAKKYNTAGTFNIKLVIATGSGCKDSITRSVHVLPVPVAAFTINSKTQCLTGNSFVFNNTTNTGGASPMNYTWQFIPGSSFTTQNISNQTMTDTGWYGITLTARSGFGCSSNTADAIYVAEMPIVSIFGDDACQGLPITFNSTATVNTGSIASYAWTYGDGNGSSQSDPVYTYGAAGAFNAQLTVTSDKGCVTSVGPVVINVFPKPVAAFTAVQTETRGIETDHLFTYTGSGASIYQWLFHDGQTSSNPGPFTITFQQQGVKPVKLVVISPDGCMDSVTKTILLNPALQMWIPNTFSPNDDGLNESFKPSTIFGLTNYSLLVFDRWGNKMFDSKDPSIGWNGADSNGEPAIEGVYAYRMVFRYVDGKLFVYRGTVTLMR